MRDADAIIIRELRSIEHELRASELPPRKMPCASRFGGLIETETMHTYRKTPDGPWTVGFICEHDPWHAIADFDHEWKAAVYTSFLNGGSKPIALLEEMWPITA